MKEEGMEEVGRDGEGREIGGENGPVEFREEREV